MILLISVIFVISNIFIVKSFPGNSDEVTDLPGLTFKINYRHYSGYLNSTDGRFLHYWFVESQRNPSQDPVVLWLNGGPGCSSLLGFLTEQGPLHVHRNGKTLYANEQSWNKVANVLFLEAPAGVGFSYKNDKQYATDDDQTADANYAALESFFEKFPQYKSNKFFVTGESYGGIYVPTLSVRILRGKANINFIGFAVGNGFLDANLLGNSLIYFGYYHGLYGHTLWGKLTTSCCDSSSTCSFVNNSNPDCQSAVSQASSIIYQPDLNVYNLYAKCENASQLTSNKTHEREFYDRKLMLKSLSLEVDQRLISSLKDTPPCVDTSYVEKWINQPDVRKSLHIPPDVPDWQACSLQVEQSYKTLYNTMKPQILELVNSRIYGLIYNGDVDMACNFLGDEWFADDLGLKLLQDYQTWYYDKQIGGFMKIYDGLGFVTIRGSGHMVPGDKPGPSLEMIEAFLTWNGTSLGLSLN